jgi:hypothetical protein
MTVHAYKAISVAYVQYNETFLKKRDIYELEMFSRNISSVLNKNTFLA